MLNLQSLESEPDRYRSGRPLRSVFGEDPHGSEISGGFGVAGDGEGKAWRRSAAQAVQVNRPRREFGGVSGISQARRKRSRTLRSEKRGGGGDYPQNKSAALALPGEEI